MVVHQDHPARHHVQVGQVINGHPSGSSSQTAGPGHLWSSTRVIMGHSSRSISRSSMVVHQGHPKVIHPCPIQNILQIIQSHFHRMISISLYVSCTHLKFIHGLNPVSLAKVLGATSHLLSPSCHVHILYIG